METATVTPSSALPPADRRKLLTAALNSVAIYILTYYLVWGLHAITQVEISELYGLRGIWDPSQLKYTIGDGEWWRMAVIVVYAVGPFICAVLGFIAFMWYWKRERARRGLFKLILLWTAFHCCNAFFGALLADTLTQSGSWYVPEWLFQMGNVVDVLFALIGALIQLALGHFGAIAFLQAHDSRTVMNYDNRKLMVAATLGAPWVVGGLFIALAKAPYLSIQESLHLLMMGLLVAPMALECLSEAFSDPVKRPQRTHVAWGLVLLAVLVAWLWRWSLTPPVLFGQSEDNPIQVGAPRPNQLAP